MLVSHEYKCDAFICKFTCNNFHFSLNHCIFVGLLTTTTTGESIFLVVKNYFDEHNIPMGNICSCASDGAPAMRGVHQGFLARLKTIVPSLTTVHCILHRHHLVAKTVSKPLHEILTVVIRAVNYLKANALRERFFKQLCEENDEVHIRLLMHTEVRVV